MGRSKIKISPKERERRIELLWDCINQIGECRMPTKNEIDNFAKRVNENSFYTKLLKIGGLKKLSQELDLPMLAVRKIDELNPTDKIHIETDVSPGVHEMFSRLNEFYGVSKKAVLAMLIVDDYNRLFGNQSKEKGA